jgi:hypothetical protein
MYYGVMSGEKLEDQEEKLSDQYVGVLTWVIQNTAVSPADCYMYMKSNKRFVQFQKRQGLTRKNLIKKLINEGVDAIFIRKEEEKHYIEFLERFLMTGYATKKVDMYIKQGKFHLLEFPRGIQISHNLKSRIKNALPEGYVFDFLESILDSESFTTEDEERESRVLEVLYDDIGLGSDAEQPDSKDQKHDEVIELMNEMSTLREENDHLREKLKQIDEKEKEVRKAYDDLYSVEGDKNQLQKMVEELQRKLKITEAELESHKDGSAGGSDNRLKEKERLERKVEDLREEAKEFKLKYARELEETKKLKRELHETTTRLNKTAMALKRITDK